MTLELNSDVLDYKWGSMPPQDIPGQMTRSMLEMRKAKAYEAKSLISGLESKTYAMYGHANQIADLSMPPPFQPNRCAISHKEKSTTLNSVTGRTHHELLAACKLENQFRHGISSSHLVPISQDTAVSLLKESVQAVAAHAGYEEMTTSSLNELSGVTKKFLEGFSKCLRDALDREAETGCPPFYDVLDEALNHSGTKSLQDLQLFWNLRVIQRHKNLEKQAKALSQEVRSLSFHAREVDAAQSTHNRFGKWTPVAGMRSGSDIGRRCDLTNNGSIKRSIKSEHHDYNYKDMPDIFTERKPAQENPFDFDDGADDFGLGELNNHHMPKRSRNLL